MSDDLVMQAIVALKGKWPNDYEALIVSTNRNVCCGAGTYQDFTGGKSQFDALVEMFANDVWLWVCTRSEFETRLQELADAAPDGATHFTAKDRSFIECWLQKRGNGWWFMPTKADSWVYLNHQSSIENRVLIELPPKTQAPETYEFVPKIGEECEHPTGQGIVKLPVDANGVVILEDEGVYKIVAQSLCRPLKTKAEKDRESLIHIVCGEEGANIKTTKPDEIGWGEIADRVIGAGWRPTNDADRSS